jgi:hypothetical protein
MDERESLLASAVNNDNNNKRGIEKKKARAITSVEGRGRRNESFRGCEIVKYT